jgi:uncharacterized protein (TIGR03083 family)
MTAASIDDLACECEPITDLIAEIRPDQWKAPTPCTEWNVRDPVNHVVGMDLVFAALIEGGPMPERGADRPHLEAVVPWRRSWSGCGSQAADDDPKGERQRI